ncbi:probable sugar dehydrogenase (homolog to aldose sugar dehydrogenase) [Natronomonas pharaonis DSM 2160]|uniref:Probable sugar dehydrogenase (Homolog to aldose sugar dehydrogenase) n=1 Tax=Natronomonas pharaonis (strain ATCC 35678 / DSM 2160 / CIP 103997 / JCM 8858 / NBRC 14720 / NCIMB 2260 / Gabara) TaxID=348780 RepID=A0A1U7ETJ1_NATPD|nr:PQQ-dependent sugar dehydrogenase [Natronomonas pharaonis]CAI48218.1 probable sugar dehydrogenase (homolog to aldose sugar dehydrogenase) [Natronomonas pharaonis DSM 2160]
MPRFDRRDYLRAAGLAGAAALAGCTDVFDDNGETPDAPEETEFTVETVADGFAHPWGMAFLPNDEQLLVTEREGSLSLLDRESGDVDRLDGLPDVHAAGQGGLLDIALDPDFESEPWVYLTYAATNGQGESTTCLGRGRLAAADGRLEDFERLYTAEPFVDSTQHYGSRVVFGEDGMVYMTTGDRGDKDFGPDHVSQDPSNDLGATLRLAPDGTVPEDNPFTDDPDINDAIFSYGHRNAQGMDIHPDTGDIWQSEHGERDGDEINIIERGGNHGWPVVHYGCEYGTDEPVGEQPHERDDTVGPVYYWECGSGGFPPSGAMFYDGDAFPEWRGDLFVGNLAGQYLGRFTVDGTVVEETSALLADRDWRIRAIETAPDTDFIYVAVDAGDAPIVRLRPA